MTTGNKDEYIVVLTRNNLKNIATDLWTMMSCNFMAFSLHIILTYVHFNEKQKWN